MAAHNYDRKHTTKHTYTHLQTCTHIMIDYLWMFSVLSFVLQEGIVDSKIAENTGDVGTFYVKNLCVK